MFDIVDHPWQNTSGNLNVGLGLVEVEFNFLHEESWHKFSLDILSSELQNNVVDSVLEVNFDVSTRLEHSHVGFEG